MLNNCNFLHLHSREIDFLMKVIIKRVNIKRLYLLVWFHYSHTEPHRSLFLLLILPYCFIAASISLGGSGIGPFCLCITKSLFGVAVVLMGGVCREEEGRLVALLLFVLLLSWGCWCSVALAHSTVRWSTMYYCHIS